MSKNINLFRITCCVLAGILVLFCANFFGFASAKSEYDGGTFEEFYAQVVNLYEKYGDINKGDSILINKDEVVEKDGELYLSASALNTSLGDSAMVTAMSETSSEDELVALSKTDYIVEEGEEEYLLSEPSYTNRIIVYYEGDLPAYNTDAYAEGLGWHIYQYTSSEDVEEAYNYYDSLPYVDFVDYDEVIVGADTESEEIEEISATSTNSYLSWGAYYTGIDEYLSYLTYIYSESELETVYVPILDSGVNTSHELLAGRYSKTYGKNFTVTDSSNNIIENTNINDDEGHGSHTAGIIADQTLSNVVLIPCKVLKSDGKGSVSMIVAAIEYIIDLKETNNLNIRVMNMSLGVESEDGSAVHSTSLENVMKKAYNADIMSVVSAGNSHFNTAANAPANMFDEVIVVSALEESLLYEDGLKVASYSNYGSTVDISAPGTHIYSSYKGGSRAYQYLDGTSMAAPHVTAAIANLLSNPSFSSMSNEEIRNLIFENAIDLGETGKDIYYGYGCVDISDIGVDTIGEVVFSVTESMATEPFELALSYDYGINYEIYYTLDGTSPSLDDNLYSEPITLNTTTKVTAAAFIFDDDGNLVAKSKVTSMTYYFDNMDLASNFVVSGNGTSGTLTQYNGTLTDLVVPETINGVAITSVTEGAFSYSKVENVEFKSSSLILNDYAFYGLSSLKSFKGDGVASVGAYAFANCTNLVSVEIDNVFNVGNYVFKNCTSLDTLNLSYARSIGVGALEELDLTTLSLGANLSTFGESYFHADTIYAYEITGLADSLKNYTDELVLLDMKFTEDYPTQVVLKSSNSATLTFTYFANELYRTDYRFTNFDDFNYPFAQTFSATHTTHRIGENLYQTTFTFSNLSVGSYGFQFYINDNYNYVLSSNLVKVIVLTGSEEEFSLNYEGDNFEVYVDNIKADDGFLLYGDLTYEIKIKQSSGYYISSVTVNDESVTLDEDNTFTIEDLTGDVNLVVNIFEKEDFDISFTIPYGVEVKDSNGFVVISSTVTRGQDYTFQIIVDEAYSVTYVEIDGVRQPIQDSYTIQNVLNAHTVEIGAQLKSFVITVNYGAGGTASVQNSERVNYGENETIYLEADEGYVIKSVLVNGEEVEVVNGALTLTNITSNMSITVLFEEEGDGWFEGVRLIIFVCFCMTFAVFLILVIVYSVKKNKSKRKIS